MIKIVSVQTIDGKILDHAIPSQFNQTINATDLTILPALIDPHVHFRTPGHEYKENWESGARAAIAGGVTTVFDMPNTNPATTTLDLLKEKKAMIEGQLNTAGIPLRHCFYLGAHKDHLDQIAKARGQYIGIKVFMGASTGNLLMDDDTALDEVFRIAAQIKAVVAVHAEDQGVIDRNTSLFQTLPLPGGAHPAVRGGGGLEARLSVPRAQASGGQVSEVPASDGPHRASPVRGGVGVRTHSKIRSREAAVLALEKALKLAKKYHTRLYVLHCSTKEEVEMMRKAKKSGIDVYMEVTPHHLFLTEADYEKWGTLVQMNPPLRAKSDQDALWAGIKDGTIDAIGTDHAPHTLEEKRKPYGDAPSGVPGIETMLPLLLNAVNEGKLTLADVVRLTRTNIEKIFHLEPNDDVVLVDMNETKEVRNEELKTKCGWSPFAGRILNGWPMYTILKGRIYEI